MRRIRGRFGRDLEKQLGLIGTDPVIPQIRRRQATRYSERRRFHRKSLVYSSYLLMLLGWILATRVLIPFYMTTHVFSSWPGGLQLQLTPSALSAEQLDQFADGQMIRTEFGEALLTPAVDRVLQVQVTATGRLAVGDGDYSAGDVRELCRPGSSGEKVVAILAGLDATYEEVVTAIEVSKGFVSLLPGCDPHITAVLSTRGIRYRGQDDPLSHER